jgi:magnesium-transporting ATPase (P-type)
MNAEVSAGENLDEWWDWRLLGRWILVNTAAYLVIVVGGVALQQFASRTTEDLARNHRLLTILIVALIGAAFHGSVLGRWQWRILRHRLRHLMRRQWVVATFVPALIVWIVAIAPEAVDTLAKGGDTLEAFKNGFIQALVLGPLVGLSQAAALRDDTTRWMWWFAANVTTWLVGAASYEAGKWLMEQLSLSASITPAFPLVAFVVHGAWMLWVTAPDATRDVLE